MGPYGGEMGQLTSRDGRGGGPVDLDEDGDRLVDPRVYLSVSQLTSIGPWCSGGPPTEPGQLTWAAGGFSQLTRPMRDLG